MDGGGSRRSRREARNGRRCRRHPSPWFPLFFSFARLLCPTSPHEGRELGRGGQDGRPSRRCPAAGRSAARCGDVVAIASPRSGRGGRPSLSLSADTRGRSGERLAMVWTVKTSDGAEERRGTGEDGGGILRPGSLSSFPFCLLFCSALPLLLEGGEGGEGRGRARGGKDGRPSRLCPSLLLAFVFPLYIIMYI